MCMYCEKIATTTISDNGTCYHDRPSRMNGNFIRYNCDADEFVLMNSNEKVICCMDYCPWCGRDLHNDSNTIHAEVKEECYSYAFQLTTFDSDIHNVEITDLFYPNYKSIEECEQGLERLIDEGEAVTVHTSSNWYLLSLTDLLNVGRNANHEQYQVHR